MSAVFRHIGVRLWLTALFGVAVCTVLLPYWQRLAAMTWIALPVMLMLAVLFVGFGWLMNRVGHFLIRRQVAEAAVWERAGMLREAEAVFERSKSVYDSFWFSPLQRQRSGEFLAMRLARFYLAQPALGDVGRSVVGSYLRMRPTDEPVAQGWLEEACRRQHTTSADHEVAVLIGSAWGRHEKIQKLLADFYLSQQRTDFEAMQTYRRVWQMFQEHAREWVHGLCDLLLRIGHINNWTLQVYLQGHASGHERCIEGLAAARRHLKPNADNRSDLSAAGQALSHLSDEQIATLASRFRPREPAAPAPRKPSPRPVLTAILRQSSDRAIVMARQCWARLSPFADWAWAWTRSLPVRMRWAAVLTLIASAGAWMIVDNWPSESDAPEVPPPIAPLAEQPPVVIDPFTIQVAAYLKRDDAQRYVDRLKEAGVDAFWTQAKSTQRTWYQVKASHFATLDEARMYGESLKARGLIDDFYVANHGP